MCLQGDQKVIFYKHKKQTIFIFLKNKAGMLYKMLVSYSAAYIKNLGLKLWNLTGMLKL